jgi:hypothetical protein
MDAKSNSTGSAARGMRRPDRHIGTTYVFVSGAHTQRCGASPAGRAQS